MDAPKSPIKLIFIGIVTLAVSIQGARLLAPYQISGAAVADVNGNPVVFRLNTITGGVEICFVTQASSVQCH